MAEIAGYILIIYSTLNGQYLHTYTCLSGVLQLLYVAIHEACVIYQTHFCWCNYAQLAQGEAPMLGIYCLIAGALQSFRSVLCNYWFILCRCFICSKKTATHNTYHRHFPVA